MLEITRFRNRLCHKEAPEGVKIGRDTVSTELYYQALSSDNARSKFVRSRLILFKLFAPCTDSLCMKR